MNSKHVDDAEVTAVAQPENSGFIRWLQEPMGSVIASSFAVIGSFGVVLSGTWFIQLALN